MKFATHPEAESYPDSVRLAVESRTNRTVESIAMVRRNLTLTLDADPSAAEKDEIDDILAATERYRTEQTGNSLTYELQAVDPDDPELPDAHMTFEERIAELVGDVGKLGENRGGTPPEDVTPNHGIRTVEVTLPENASDTAKGRVEQAMLAFGKVRHE